MKLIKKSGAAVLCICMVMTLAMTLPGRVRAEETAGQPQAESGQDTASGGSDQPAADSGNGNADQGNGGAANTLAQILLSVGDGQETPVFKAGEETSLSINIMNKGNQDAQNVQISPVVENVNDWPFDMSRLNYDKSVGTVKAGEQLSAVWGNDDGGKLVVREDVTGQSYKLVFRITYDDGQKAYETTKYVFVKTEAAPQKGNEQNNDQGDSSNESGQENQSGSGGGDENGGEAAGGTDAGGWDAGMEAGGVYNSDPIVSGGSGSTTDGSVPRVIVTGFDTNPKNVKAGSDFKLTVHLKNTSKKTAVSNMLFDFQAPASGTDAAAEAPAFLPTSGSSSVYLDKIAADGTKDISIELNARADLVQKPYSIEMSMKYEDKSATQFEGSSSLAIPIKQEPRFEFSEIQVAPDTVSVGEEANITSNLYNLGRVKLYNVKVKFEGDAIEGQEQFIGNLDSGATGMIDGIVTAMAEAYDESNCKLIMTYEDDAGNVSTVEQPFTMTVIPAADMTDMTMTDIPEEQSGPSIPVILLVIVIVIAVAAIITVVVIRRRKKKLIAAEEEELMDEVDRLTEDEHQQP